MANITGIATFVILVCVTLGLCSLIVIDFVNSEQFTRWCEERRERKEEKKKQRDEQKKAREEEKREREEEKRKREEAKLAEKREREATLLRQRLAQLERRAPPAELFEMVQETSAPPPSANLSLRDVAAAAALDPAPLAQPEN